MGRLIRPIPVKTDHGQFSPRTDPNCNFKLTEHNNV